MKPLSSPRVETSTVALFAVHGRARSTAGAVSLQQLLRLHPRIGRIQVQTANRSEYNMSNTGIHEPVPVTIIVGHFSRIH